MNELKKFRFVFVVLVFIFTACERNEEIDLIDNDNLLDKDIILNNSDVAKDNTFSYEGNTSKESCDKYFGKKSSSMNEYSFQGLNLIEKQFNNEEIKGWCLYRKAGNNYQTIASGYNWRGISPISFSQDKYLFYREGCGTACTMISRLNIYDYNDNIHTGVRSSFEMSSDNKWLIEYDYSMHEGYRHMDYLAKAVNLDNFETIDFAKNNCLDGDCDFEFVGTKENGEINFIDESEGVVKILFVDKITGEKVYRTFDMNDNFKEI